MQATDIGNAIERLQELANKEPGWNPMALTEANSILLRMGSGSATGYLSEKLAATSGSFEIWLSDSKWQKYGNDPQAFRTILLQDIEKLRKALARGAAGQD